MSADLQRWEHGNPEEVAIRREAMTCKGCEWREVVIVFGCSQEYCGLGKPYGKRCKKYKEAINAQ